jgi:preprotein translocase subunit SecD
MHILIVFFCFTVGTIVAQPGGTGFYFATPCPKHQKPYTVLLDKSQSVCLPNQPVITIEEIQSVTDLEETNKTIFFHIILTQAGYKRLQKLTAQLSNGTLAFVVDQQVVSLINLKTNTLHQTIQFKTYVNQRSDLVAVHQKLKREMNL